MVDGNFGVHAIVPKAPFGYELASTDSAAPAPKAAEPATSGATAGAAAVAATLLAAALLAALLM